MSLQKNVIDGWITTIIGVVTMIISLVLVWRGVFDFVWEGVAGLSIGTILLLAPKSIEKLISKYIGNRPKDSYDTTQGGDI